MNRLDHRGIDPVFLKHLICLHYRLIKVANCLRALNMVLRVHIEEVIIDGDFISFELGDRGLIQLEYQYLQVEVCELSDAVDFP